MSSKRNRLGGRSRRRIGGRKTGTLKKFSLLSRGIESLEVRTLLAVDSGSAWTNPRNAYDVDGNGMVQPADLLLLVDDLNRLGPRSLMASSASDSSGQAAKTSSLSLTDDSSSDLVRSGYLDVNADGDVTPQDALMVANALNNPPPSATIGLEILGLDGQPLDGNSIGVGEYFLVKASAQDLIQPTEGPDFEGIFSAFIDIAFIGSGAAVPAASEAVQFDSEFDVALSEGTYSSNFIDEIGGATQDPSPNQPTQTVFYVALQATGQGQLTFQPQFATGTGHEVFTFSGYNKVGNTTVFIPLTANDIDFVSSETLTITAASALPKASVATFSDVSILEGNSGTKNMTFTVTLSNGNYDTRLSYTTVDGTATSNPPSPFPRDYNATSGFITFAAGETSKTITVQVRGDQFLEGTENFTVQLSNLLNGNTGSPGDLNATGTITEEATDVAGLIVSDPAITETAGGTTATFTVTRTPTVSAVSTAVFATSNGSAVAGRDYTATSGTLTFGANETSKTVTVNVLDDTIFEANETFFLQLSSPSNAIVLKNGTATITDNETSSAPVGVAILDPAAISEGNSGTKSLSFTITISAQPTSNVVVNYATADNGSAVAGTDYQATSGTLTFTPTGSLSQTISVLINGDATGEGNETFLVNLSGLTGPAALEDSSATGTILNDDGATTPSLSVNDVTVSEAAGTASFTVTLSAASTSQVTVAFGTGAVGDTAAAGSDYTATSGTLTFAAGVTTQTITVPITNDPNDENDETFTVTLSSPVNATIGDQTGVGTITDNDNPPLISIGPNSKLEGNAGSSNLTLPVTLSTASGKTVTVVYTTTNGGAVAPGDYTTTTGTLTFAPGVTSQNATISIVGDTTFEPDESFTVTLSSPTNASLGTSSALGTITNDDASPNPTISISDVSTAENVAGLTQTFNVTLSQAGTSQITVVYATGAGGDTATAGADYTATSGTLTFAVGETSKPITVLLNNDLLDEPNETYTVTLSNPVGSSATIADGTGIGTIVDDDPTPSLSVGDLTNSEAAGTFNVPVTLSAASGQTVTVVFATGGGTATAGTDYTATSGTLTFTPGQTSKLIPITVSSDSLDEVDETFNVTLSNSTNATVADNTGLVTITDDDNPPNVTINNVTQAETNSGTSNFVFTVSLSAASGKTITVPFSTANGSATAPADYTATSGTLTFNAGTTSQQITVAVVGDLIDENDETFNVNLGTAVNANVTTATGLGTIQDNDGPPGLSIADLSQSETNGATNFDFTVTLPVASAQQITVVYTTGAVGDTATAADNDYTTTTGTLTFAPGATSQTARVVVNGDTRFEANETFTVTLSNAVNATISDGIAAGNIQNDDAQPTFTIGDAGAQTEGDSSTKTFTFPVTLSAVSGLTSTVVFAATNGTATIADGDFAATNGTLSFAPGETSKNVTVLVNGDTKNEANETFTVALSGATNAGIADGSGSATITNDDPLPNLSIADATFTEGDAGSKNFGFIVTLSAVSGQQVTVNFATASNTATAGSDFTATSGVLTFAPGETSKTVNVSVTGDTLSELNENFAVNLTGAVNANVTTGTATGDIINDDAPPGLSINDVSLTEGNAGTKSFNFTVSLAEVSGIATTVQFTTGGGNATAGTDYAATNGTLTFAAGETSKTVSVLVNGDLVNEADETFNVTLSNASNSTPISIPIGIGTIQNDDILSLSIGDFNQNEGNAATTNFTFNVTLSGESDQPILVPFSTTGGTASSSSDFVATGGTLTFAAGETSKQVTVAVNGDTTFESNETFQVGISTSAAGVNVTKASGAGTITNDDAAPIVSIGDVSLAEGTATGGTTDFVFTVTVTGATELPVTVNFSTADGTAIVAPDTTTVGRDYTATSGVLTFAVGETSKTVTVKVRADRGFESDESFTVNLTNAGNASIGDGSGLGTIQNDDPEGSFDSSSIAGSVFIDSNNNGIWDAAEKALAGVTITLTPDADADFPGALSYEAITAADGSFLFEDVETGDYVMKEIQPGFYLDGSDKVGTQGATSVENDTFHISVDGGAEYTGNLFAERGVKPAFISKRLLMASSAGGSSGIAASQSISAGQFTLPSISADSAGTWYSLDDGFDGILTVIANGVDGAGSAKLTLYDEDLQQLTSSTGSNGDTRIDWTGTTGQPYFLRVQGSNPDVDVQLTNLVSIIGSAISVRGTTGDDTFSYDASGSTHTYTINGVSYTLNPASGMSVNFQGGAGDDHVNLIDSAFDDELSGDNDTLSFSNSNGLSLIAEGIESARAQSSTGGNDSSDLAATDFALELVGDWS